MVDLYFDLNYTDSVMFPRHQNCYGVSYFSIVTRTVYKRSMGQMIQSGRGKMIQSEKLYRKTDTPEKSIIEEKINARPQKKQKLFQKHKTKRLRKQILVSGEQKRKKH